MSAFLVSYFHSDEIVSPFYRIFVSCIITQSRQRHWNNCSLSRVIRRRKITLSRSRARRVWGSCIILWYAGRRKGTSLEPSVLLVSVALYADGDGDGVFGIRTAHAVECYRTLSSTVTRGSQECVIFFVYSERRFTLYFKNHGFFFFSMLVTDFSGNNTPGSKTFSRRILKKKFSAISLW